MRTVEPPANTSDRPSPIPMVPKVMMNGATPVKAIKIPLNAPNSIPHTIPIDAASTGGRPETIPFAVITPTKPAIAPIDKSVPWIRIARKEQMAMMVMMDDCFTIFTKLDKLKK